MQKNAATPNLNQIRQLNVTNTGSCLNHVFGNSGSASANADKTIVSAYTVRANLGLVKII